MVQLKITALERALASLEGSLSPPPANDRERDGSIHRFEYTFETAWKLAQKFLARDGIVSTSPKMVIRDMAQQGWITNPSRWIQFLTARNYSSHTYNQQVADWVFSEAKVFAEECKNLLDTLRARQ
jgi:nucleotidyltransferase substrate binding protein (TIGR01987 family)